jgi:hypothetical protein
MVLNLNYLPDDAIHVPRVGAGDGGVLQLDAVARNYALFPILNLRLPQLVNKLAAFQEISSQCPQVPET